MSGWSFNDNPVSNIVQGAANTVTDAATGNFGQAGTDLWHPLNDVGTWFHHTFFNPKGAAPLVDPPPPPSLGEVTQGNLENNVALERNMRASSALYGSGGGLSDAPMTASRTLLGN